MTFKHVFAAGPGVYSFRITLPGGLKFQAEESWPVPSDAAFAVDLLKFYVSKRFGLKGFSLLPSLPLSTFSAYLRDVGINRDNLDDVRFALSYSTKEFLLDGANELLTEFAANLKAAPVLGWDGLTPASTKVPLVGSSDYLKTLLGALPNRLTDALKILRKAGQLNSLSEEKKAAISALGVTLSDVEASTRSAVERILSMP